MDSVEECARCWAQEDKVEVGMLSEWIKAIVSLVNRCISSSTMSTRRKLVFNIPDVSAELADLHDIYVVVQQTKHLTILC